MKKHIIIGFLLVSVGLQALAKINEHKSSEHQTHKHGTKGLMLDNGKKWSVDATMEKSMGEIIDKFHQVENLKKENKTTDADFKALAATIKTATANIVKNCKLTPKADATFHVILAELLGAEVGLANPKTALQSLEKIHSSLEVYKEYFDHPAH